MIHGIHNICHKYLFTLLIITCLLFILSFSGCGRFPFPHNVPYGLDAVLKFDKAPKTHEKTNLSWCIKALEDYEQIDAWVQFEYDSGKPRDTRKLPLREVEETMLLEGQLSFEGSLKEGEEKQFNAVITFPFDGEWVMVVYFYGKSVIRDLTRDTGNGRPYYAGTGRVERIYVSEEYSHFGSSKFFHVYDQIRTPNEVQPVSGYVDIDKPPDLNEPTQINWGAGSIRDIDKVHLRLQFDYMEPGSRKSISVPSEEIIISGDRSQIIDHMSKDKEFESAFDGPIWELDKTPRESIIEHSSVHFSTIVRFPREGDWKVRLEVGKDNRFEGASTSNLCFNVSDDERPWGWEEKHW